MNRSIDLPLFTIKAVAHETGLKPVTIRAWERRYGLPEPQRAEGGSRRYSRRDIALLHWLVARQAEGLPISQAVAMWELVDDHAAALLPFLETLPNGSPSPPDAAPVGGTPQLDELRRRWVEACLRFDQTAAEQTLAQAFALFPAETVAHVVLREGLAEIGAGWYRGAITIQQEHFASALTLRRLELLVAATPPPTRPQRVLIGCAPGDSHTFAPLLLTYALRLRGWDVVYLGPNVPTLALAETVEQVAPSLIVLSAQQLHTAAALQASAEAVAGQGIPLAYGGTVFHENPLLQARIPGRYMGNDLEAAPALVAQMVAAQRAPDPVAPPDAAHRQTLEQYTRQRALIEAHVWSRFAGEDWPAAHLTNVNNDVAQTISAALRLGDIRLLPAEAAWWDHLLMGYRLPPGWLSFYLESYLDGLRSYLEPDGALLADWSDILQASMNDPVPTAT